VGLFFAKKPRPQDPYHDVCIQPGENGGSDFLLVGGEDHKRGEADCGRG
jgi:hypothetical protein